MLVSALALVASSAMPAGASPNPSPPPTRPQTADGKPAVPESPAVQPSQRTALLGSTWQQSTDRAWTTIGDATGFHLLLAEAKTGYTWRTAATLKVPGLQTDQWIGNACLTASGKHAMVVYAPRSFTNTAEFARRGGFTAIVDLRNGAVRKLPITASLAYFNPGCGTGEQAVLTQEGDEDLGKTRLVKVDTDTGEIGAGLQLGGQITSAVPTPDGIAAAEGYRLVKITAKGHMRRVAAATSVPALLRVDREGGVSYLVRQGGGARVLRTLGSKTNVLAEGTAGQLGLDQGSGGRVFITGAPSKVGRLPAGITRVNSPASAELSTEGGLALTSVATKGNPFAKNAAPASDPRTPQRVDISAVATGTGKSVSFGVDPQARLAPKYSQGQAPVRVYGAQSGGTSGSRIRASAAGSPTDPRDTDGWCSVSRNDVRAMAYQPTPRQVEWAVDMAVLGKLTPSRPDNYRGFGLPAFSPQGMFPARTDVHVPAQILLGILSQESNLWQASGHALSGEYANPLTGSIYGLQRDDKTGAFKDWVIHWDKADCGYGISQLTDGMRKPEHSDGKAVLTENAQKAVALDYATSIAAGLQLVQDKWLQIDSLGLKLNDGDPNRIENWFFATWAYNSGFYPQADTAKNNGAWGLGWFNNPANPRYPERLPFLYHNSWADAAKPQNWPYPEKIIGFASYSISTPDGPGFRPAWWTTDSNRDAATPKPDTFCNSSNDCEPGAAYVPNDPDVIGQPAGPCAHKNPANGLYDLHCYIHQSTTWKSDCSNTCGHELNRFEDKYPEQPDGTHFPPQCDKAKGLPSGALVVDDIPNGTPIYQCGTSSSAGSFNFNFAEDPAMPGTYPGKIDLHQLGGGYSGHFWFGHTRTLGNKLNFSGTWTLGQSINGWSRVLVHLPDHGAQTQQAKYEVNLGTGWDSKHFRYINQARGQNSWVSIGVYKFAGTPQVRLSNETLDGYGEDDIAYDAIAFQKLPAKPKHIVAALGDSFSSGEGAGSYYHETDTNHGTPQWNACRRSTNAWSRKMTLPGTSNTLGALVDNWDPNAELGFVACSGAWNVDVSDWRPESWDNPSVYEKGEGQFREVSQSDSGVLNDDTTLVTLTISGNDDNIFIDAMNDCGGLGNCADGLLDKYKPKVDTAVGALRTTLTKIHKNAPNAQIVLVGYPELLSRTVKCSGSLYFDLTETQALGDLVRYGDGKQGELVKELSGSMKIAYVGNVVDKFTGHSGCDDPEWINKFVNGPNGDGDFHSGDRSTQFCISNSTFCFSRESFHPKDAGTTGYAELITAFLKSINYQGS